MTPTAHLESLENRTLLAASVGLVGRELVITGTDQGDTIVITRTRVLTGRTTSEWGVRVNVSSPWTTQTVQWHVQSSFDRIRVEARGGNDTVTNNSPYASFIRGQAGKDRLVGGSGDDEIHGDGNNDRIVGGWGNDQLFGDDGLDRLYGDTEEEIEANVPLGGGVDFLDGGSDEDVLFGGSGNDRLLGGDDNDDQLYGQRGEDFLDGMGGLDVIDGGPDTDTAILHEFDAVFSIERRTL